MRSDNDGAVLAFTGTTVRYGKTTAVDAVSLAVGKGEVYALLGRNGSGKTSMIRCLLGQIKAASGRAGIFGLDSWNGRREAMAKVGVVPETADAPRDLTVKGLVAFCAPLYPSWDEKGVAARLARFKVPERIPFGRLSRGQKSQVAMALALGPKPELLVLDDPTLGLDVVARKEFFEELVGDLADRGTTVFLSTHDLAGIEGIATRAGILRGGRLAVDDGMETLKARFRAVRFPKGPVPAVPDEMAPLLQREDALGTEMVLSRFDEGAFASFAQDLSPTPQVASMSLEEIFIALAGEEGGPL